MPLIQLIALLLAIALPASARADGPTFNYRVRDKLMAGEGNPAITLVPNGTVKKLRLTLTRRGAKKRVFKSGRLPAGRERTFEWKQKPGRVRYKATLTAADTRGVESTLQFEFEVAVVLPLEVKVDKSLENIEDHRVVLRANRAIAKIGYEIKSPTGTLLAKGEQTYPGAKAGSNVTLAWEQEEGDVGVVNLEVHDELGFWSGVELSPFWVEIPHEEVVFESGKWAIPSRERPKLDGTLNTIREELSKYGGLLQLRLYVAGYTDTVDSAAYNLKLSTKRARSIGAYFRRRGLRIPISYQGLGEHVLAVMTADNVPEARNRRAIYVLGNAPPPRSAAIPRSSWSSLK